MDKVNIYVFLGIYVLYAIYVFLSLIPFPLLKAFMSFISFISLNKLSEAEFKEFEPQFNSAKTRFKLSAGLNLETFDTILSGTNHI